MKILTALILTLGSAIAQAQSACSSDGQSAPSSWLERFISADCEDCWSAPSPQQPGLAPDALALDWIVPGARGDDAPLGGATREAFDRLEMLHANAPQTQSSHALRLVEGAGLSLRVALGLPLANYVGASIELTPATGGPWRAVLLLVQHIPAATQGTPIARNLVRNMRVTSWDRAAPASSPSRYFELWPMSLPEGTRPEQLSALAWVQDADGRLLALAQSRCAPDAASMAPE